MLKIVNVWLGLQTSEMPEDWKKEEKLKEASVPLRERHILLSRAGLLCRALSSLFLDFLCHPWSSGRIDEQEEFTLQMRKLGSPNGKQFVQSHEGEELLILKTVVSWEPASLFAPFFLTHLGKQGLLVPLYR